MLGAYACVLANNAGLPLWAAYVAAALLVGLFGVLVERVIIRFLYGRLIDTLLATWGLSLFLVGAVTTLFGPQGRSVSTSFGNIALGGTNISSYNLVLIGIAVVMLAATWALARLTTFGLLVRGTMQDPTVAGTLGVNRDLIYMATFGYGSALAGLAGAVLVPITGAAPTMGVFFVAETFITVITGGHLPLLGTMGAAGLFGTIDGVVIPALERTSGKRAGAGFAVCSNPEFLREGTSIKDFYDPPFTLIGAAQPSDAEPVAALYAGIKAPLHVAAVRVAEMVKYVCNCFHGLKVGFANEIGNICKSLEVDSHEVMRIFCEDRKLNISPAYLKPGFAFGGSCLPKDLRALTYQARTLDVDTPILAAEALRTLVRSSELAVGGHGWDHTPMVDLQPAGAHRQTEDVGAEEVGEAQGARLGHPLGLLVGDELGEPAGRRQHRERDDERDDPPVGDQEAVDQSDRGRHDERREDHPGRTVRLRRERRRPDRRERDDRTDGQVDPAADDDEGHADADDADSRPITQDGQHVGFRREPRAVADPPGRRHPDHADHHENDGQAGVARERRRQRLREPRGRPARPRGRLFDAAALVRGRRVDRARPWFVPGLLAHASTPFGTVASAPERSWWPDITRSSTCASDRSPAGASWTTSPSRRTRTRSARPSTSGTSLDTSSTPTPEAASARTRS